MNPQPSADAIALAESILAGLDVHPTVRPDLILGVAGQIDRDLQLPQCRAALLLAQTLVDAFGHEPNDIDANIVDHLRDALAAIRTKP